MLRVSDAERAEEARSQAQHRAKIATDRLAKGGGGGGGGLFAPTAGGGGSVGAASPAGST